MIRRPKHAGKEGADNTRRHTKMAGVFDLELDIRDIRDSDDDDVIEVDDVSPVSTTCSFNNVSWWGGGAHYNPDLRTSCGVFQDAKECWQIEQAVLYNTVFLNYFFLSSCFEIIN